MTRSFSTAGDNMPNNPADLLPIEKILRSLPMEPVILPVGFANGLRWRADKTRTYEVMLPNSAATLPVDAFKVWFSPFLNLEAYHRGAFGRPQLLEFVLALGVPNAEDILRDLEACGLLVEFNPHAPEDFFAGHTLHPCADGMGNTKDDPTEFRLEREGRYLLRLHVDVYSVWSTSVYHGSLAAGIAAYAAGTNKSPAYISVLVAASLPVIVANRCGFLQPLVKPAPAEDEASGDDLPGQQGHEDPQPLSS